MIFDWAIGNERIPHVLISIPTTVLGTDVIARMVTVEINPYLKDGCQGIYLIYLHIPTKTFQEKLKKET